MKKWLQILTLFTLLLSGTKVWSSHLFGGELFYTHVTGNTYKITLVLYADCGGTPGAFQGLPGATPTILVFNNNTLFQSMQLQPQAGLGVNVSPVCPDEINNTTCNNGTLPGVMRFFYTANITLNTSSNNWVFRFNGEFNNNTLAGRSNSITNILIPGGGSLLSLEARLNNTQSITNSSPTYTSIPTPFFCMNFPQEYNQGAVDPNGDSLVFSLVSGLAANGTMVNNVTYIFPFNATNPIGAAPGTFAFNTINGQLSFTPNIPQQALVVGRVSEYRNGVLVGTSMREMIIVVLNNCNNSPPNGTMTNPVNGTIVNGTDFRVCKFNGTISFDINVSDPNGDNVTLSTEGLPTGAVASITGNATNAPNVAFSWNITNVAPGNYTFYLNFTDDGCPLATKKTVAYTIQVLPKPTLSVSLITPSTCVTKAVFSVVTSGTDAPYQFTATQGTATVLSVGNITSSIIDSLPSGTYNFRITNASGCFADTTITFSHIVDIDRSVLWTAPKCRDGSNGSIDVTATGSHPPFSYAINNGTFNVSNQFSNLSPGSYLVQVKDNIGCVKDTTIIITNPVGILMSTLLQKPVCRPVDNGQITINATNGNSPYQFALNNGTFGSNNAFTNLAPGSYLLQIKDAENCTKDSTVILIDSFLINITPTITMPLCFGNANGFITVLASGATAPYSFAFDNNTTYTANNVLPNIPAGTYIIKVKDANNCLKDTTVNVGQPTVLKLATNINHVKCRGESTGSIVVNGIGGTPVYKYGLNAGGFSNNNTFSNLAAGTYTLKVRDTNGCQYDTLITITQPASGVQFTGIAITSPTCQGFDDGAVTLTVVGGTPPYTYKRNGQTFTNNNSFSNLTEGNYLFTVSDNNGCEKDTFISLIGFPHIKIDSLTLKNPTCFEYSNGTVTVHAQGGVQPLSYAANGTELWNASNLLVNLPDGTHVINVRDKEGCRKDTSIVLIHPNKLNAHTESGSDCNGITDGGFIIAKPDGGTAPYRFNWLNFTNADTNKIIKLNNGDYTLIVTDSNGCKDTATISLLFSACCKPFIPSAFSPNNDGNNDEYKVLYEADMNLREIHIYNRYGQRVFYATNQSKTWDGTFNGKPVDVGTYYYQIRITCGNITQKELLYQGDITLIR